MHIISEFEKDQEYIDLYIHKSQTSKKICQASSLMMDKVNINKKNSLKVKTVQYKINKSNIKFSILKCDIEGYEYYIKIS